MRSLRIVLCLFFGLERFGIVYGGGGNFFWYLYFVEELGLGVWDGCVCGGGCVWC